MDIRIYNDAGYYLPLSDNSVFGIPYEGGGFGAPTPNAIFAETWGGYENPLAGVDYGNREAGMGVYIRSTSMDGWVANDQQLKRCLHQTERYWDSHGDEGAAAYLSVKLDNMTYPVEFDILRGDVVNDPGLLSFTMRRSEPLSVAALSLTLRPWSRPQAMNSETSGTLNQGGGVGATAESFTVTAPAGDVRMPCRLTITTAAGDDMRRLVVGMKSRGTVSNIIWPLQAEENVYSGYRTLQVTADGDITLAPQVDAGASGGNEALMSRAAGGGAETNETLFTWTLEANIPDWHGLYRAYLRIDNATAAGAAGSLRLTYGGVAGTDIPNDSVTVVIAADYLLDMGIVQIPHRVSPHGVSEPDFLMALQWTSSGTTASTIQIDCLYLVPIDEAYANILFSAVLSAEDQVVIDGLPPRPSTYVLNSTGDLQPELAEGNPNTYFWLEPGRDNRFFVLFTDDTAFSIAGAHDLTDQFTMMLQWHAYYFLFRTA